MSNIKELSPLALAFIGDAVHTVFVREEVLKGGKDKLNTYNTKAKMFCNANSQSCTLEKLEPLLTDEEKDIVRKARNCKPKHRAKNFDEKTYNKATSFEALVGFLYLTKQHKRLQQILQESMQIDLNS
ncbi:MAG: Mini-ribonuclease 3 [Clostridia bacterium]|nr:Mini-ribonuclease 3 [Clostridia bacterium]